MRDPARDPQFFRVYHDYPPFISRERERGSIRFSTYASGVVAESTRLYHDALNRDDEGWTFTKTRGEKIGEIDFAFDQEIMGF